MTESSRNGNGSALPEASLAESVQFVLAGCLLVGCGVPSQDRPEPIDQTTEETAPTPSVDRNPSPTPTAPDIESPSSTTTVPAPPEPSPPSTAPPLPQPSPPVRTVDG